jgi:plasmid stability protein
MAVSMSVKNVPDELAALLRRRAADNRRSLQRELLSILEAAVGRGSSPQQTAAGRAPRDAITVEELGEIARRLFPEGTESSVAYLRQMRDRR